METPVLHLLEDTVQEPIAKPWEESRNQTLYGEDAQAVWMI